MAASFGSGVAYSLVSGAPNPMQAALTTGFAFAAFNGLFYQVRVTCLHAEISAFHVMPQHLHTA